MNPTRPLTALFALLALGAGLAQAELRPQQKYQAGAQVKSSGLGITLTLPKGWLGAYNEEGGQAVLALGSNTVEGVGLAIFLRNQTTDDVLDGLSDAQDLGGGVTLDLDGGVKRQGSRMSARYKSDEYVGRALALIGPAKNHVVYFYAGPFKNEKLYTQLLDGLAASTKFQAPAQPRPQSPQAQPPAPTGITKQWTAFLSGMMLRYLSSFNSGGGGGGISTDRSLHFCSDGSFAYLDNSLVTMNVQGASASSGGNGRTVGRWRVESGSQNAAVVVLTSEGRSEKIQVSYDGEKTFVGGERWFRVESDVCR